MIKSPLRGGDFFKPKGVFMELNVDNRPKMAKFTAPHDAYIVAYNGTKCMWFKAGETLNVHRDLFAPAIEAGLVPMDSLEAIDLEEPVLEPVTQESVEKEMIEACKELIAKGNPADFTLVGLPRAASIKKLVNSNFTARDVTRAFEETMHEVEQDGDNSEKRPEPSSSAA